MDDYASKVPAPLERLAHTTKRKTYGKAEVRCFPQSDSRIDGYVTYLTE